MSERTDQTQDATASDADGKDFGEAFGERAAPEAKPEDEEAEANSSAQGEPAEAGSDEAPAGAAAETETSGEAKPFDPWEGLTPEQKAHFQRLDASDRSQRGRVAALTRKLNTTAAAAPKAPAKQQEQQAPEVEGEVDASDLDKELASVMEDYGDVVGPLAKVLKKVQAQVDSLAESKKADASVEQDAEELADAYRVLGENHPDYREIGQDPKFAEWIAKQSAKVQSFATSYDPEEVSLTLTMFKAERSLAAQQQPAAGEDSGTQGSTATGDKRKRQIEGSRQVPARGQPAAGGTPNDFGAAFDARSKAKATA